MAFFFRGKNTQQHGIALPPTRRERAARARSSDLASSRNSRQLLYDDVSSCRDLCGALAPPVPGQHPPRAADGSCSVPALLRLAWSSAWMTRMSAPFSARWLAKLCRSVCTVTCLSRLAAMWAERHAACRTAASGGSSLSRREIASGASQKQPLHVQERSKRPLGSC